MAITPNILITPDLYHIPVHSGPYERGVLLSTTEELQASRLCEMGGRGGHGWWGDYSSGREKELFKYHKHDFF